MAIKFEWGTTQDEKRLGNVIELLQKINGKSKALDRTITELKKVLEGDK